MSDLKTNLEQILQEKEEKIIPENIKEGVQIFDIMGTLKSGGSSSGVKLFETQEEMQADADAKEGDLAVVYRNEIQNFAEDTQTQYITFPETVTLPEAFTGNVNGRLRAVDTSSMFDGNIRLDQSMFGFDGFSDNGMIRVEYTSTDGITYTRNTFEGDNGDLTNPVDLGTVVQYEPMEGEWNDTLGYFMQIGGSTFEGLFEYKSYTDSDTHPVKYKYFTAQNQLTSIADKVYNSIYYGKDGVNEGTLTQNVSNSFADVNAEIYAKIQLVYDNTEPRVLTDDDKEIDTSIYTIPTKSDGTSLLDTSQVTNMNTMFRGCTNLITIPLLDTSKVTNMDSMFRGCTNLITIPLLDTSKVTNMNNMFRACSNIQTIPSLNTSLVTDMNTMFRGCSIIQTIPELNASKVTDMSYMFCDCSNLTTIPLLDTSKVTDMSYMFENCSNLTTIPELDTSLVTNMRRMFYGCKSLTTTPLLNTSKVTDMSYMFSECSNLTTIPQLDTSQVTDMRGMFWGTNIQTIPQLDTSKVTKMGNMFRGCLNIQTIPELNTSLVTDMTWMFSDCTNLTTIPELDTSQVTDMRGMFCDCINVQTIPQLDISKVTNMYRMFENCSNLSDDSLNNVLASLLTATSYTSTKTLKYIGLSEEQATTCTTLSNWSALEAKGWTTGY